MAGRYKAGAREVVGSLRLRLECKETLQSIKPLAVIYEAAAYTDDSVGSMGWPHFVRSAVVSPVVAELDELPLANRGGILVPASQAKAYRQLSPEPVEGSGSSDLGAQNLPIRWWWKVPFESGWVVDINTPTTFLAAGGANSWTGYIMWEEK